MTVFGVQLRIVVYESSVRKMEREPRPLLFRDRWQFLQQFLICAKSLEGSVEGTSRFGEHQRVRAFCPIQRVRDIALMLIDLQNQMPAIIFTGWNATDFVCGVGQKCIQLSAELALAIHFRWTNPIGGR